MNPEHDQPEVPKPFQQAFELPGDPTLSPDFPGVEITASLPTWRAMAEKGALTNSAFVDLKNPRFMHTFDGTTWDVTGMAQVPGIRDSIQVDGLLIESGAFRINREDLFQVLDQMAPHMRNGAPVVVHEPTNDKEDHSVDRRERTLTEHGFELVQIHGAPDVLVWEGRRVNDRAELELIMKENPMIPRDLIDSPLAQQLPPGKILYIDGQTPHEAHPLDREHDWKPGKSTEDPYARPKGSHKLAAVIIGLPEALKSEELPKDLVARAGSLIQQSEDPKNEHLGAVFIVWPDGKYTPTKTELIKLFKNAGLKVDEELPTTFDATLPDGRKVIVAQARTKKKHDVPDWVRGRHIDQKKQHQAGDVVPLPDRMCADCGEHQVVERYVERYWRREGKDILKAEIICNSGKHNGGIAPILEDRFIRVLRPHQNPTPQSQSSRAHRAG